MDRLVKVALWVVILFAGAEGGTRLLEYLRPDVEEVAFDYAPYRMLRMTSAPFALNNDGFRAQEWSAYRDKFLVEFLGGSVCLGIGTNPGRPIPEQLEDSLHRAGMKDALVLNLCQGGTTSAQELAIFLQYGLPLRPHVVISFNGANDLLHPAPLGDDRQANLPYHDQEIRSLFAGHHSWMEHLSVKRVFDRIHRRLTGRRNGPDEVSPKNILDSYLYTTEVIRTLTEQQSGLYGLILQPSLHYEKPWSQDEKRMWHLRHPQDATALSEYARELFAQARSAATDWSARTQGKLFDLTETFAQTPTTVYSDSVHFQGETGFRMLEQRLEQLGLVASIEERYRQWEQSPETSGKEFLAWRQ